MDFELMINSFPKLLNATLITLKLLSASLFFGLFIGLLFAVLRMNKNPILTKFAYGYSRYSCPFSICPIKNRLFGTAPARGDIVVFRHPINGKDFVKRLKLLI